MRLSVEALRQAVKRDCRLRSLLSSPAVQQTLWPLVSDYGLTLP